MFLIILNPLTIYLWIIFLLHKCPPSWVFLATTILCWNTSLPNFPNQELLTFYLPHVYHQFIFCGCCFCCFYWRSLSINLCCCYCCCYCCFIKKCSQPLPPLLSLWFHSRINPESWLMWHLVQNCHCVYKLNFRRLSYFLMQNKNNKCDGKC